MKRNVVGCCVLGLLLLLPAVALAVSRTTIAPRIEMRGSASGTATATSGTSFTIQTTGRPTGVVNALTAAANNVTRRDYPYVYGGGHAQAGIASIGIKGPGYNGRRIGFDCSGSVAAVLAGGGLWPTGGGVPNDAGIISELLSKKLIARGVGTGPLTVNLYDDRGVHIFMSVDGRFFGTSDGGGGGNPRGGAGWLDDGAPDASSTIYKRYHVLAPALKGSTNAGHSVTFELGGVQDVPTSPFIGEKVNVAYEQTSTGMLIATGIEYPGAATTSGTVTSVADDGSSLTIDAGSGSSLTFSTGNLPQLTQALAVGDTVQVTYVTTTATMTAVSVGVTSVAPSERGS